MKNNYIKFISAIIITSIVLPLVISAQVTSTNSTSVPLELPENFGQSKNFIVPLLKKVPSVSMEIFRQQVKPRWTKMASKAKVKMSNYWYSRIKPKIQAFIDKIIRDLKLKLEEREPQIKENFQKQKKVVAKDIQKQLPSVKKTIWQWIKDLLH